MNASNSASRCTHESGNKRVWRGNGSTLDEITFWSVNGQKLATYKPVNLGGSSVYFSLTGTDVYFGSRLIAKGTPNGGTNADYVTLASVATDRLGSIGKFYPFGQERPSATANDTEKFTGYYRDAATGLDYADQRYHQPGVGRFMTADPATSSAGPSDPGSWNRYAYVRGDPVNRTDPQGTDPDDDCDLFGDCLQSSGCGLNGCPDGGLYTCSDGSVILLALGQLCPIVPPPPDTSAPPPDICSISLFERPAFGTPGNHTYLDVTDPGLGINDVLEGDPTNTHPPFRNPFGNWGNLIGYVEPVALGKFQGSTNPATNTFVASDTGGQNVCADVSALIGDVNSYNMTAGVPYRPLAGRGFYNSNSFTFTLLYQIGLVGPSGSGVFPQPPGWNPGWGKHVPGL